MTEIPAEAGKLHLVTVLDLYFRRLLVAATGLYLDRAGLFGDQDGSGGSGRCRAHHRFHTDRGFTYTAEKSPPCAAGWASASPWAGSCSDNAAAEAFFSSLEWKMLSRHDFRPPHRSARS